MISPNDDRYVHIKKTVIEYYVVVVVVGYLLWRLVGCAFGVESGITW